MCDYARFPLPERGKAILCLMWYLTSGIGISAFNETSLRMRCPLRRAIRVECILILRISAFCVQGEFNICHYRCEIVESRCFPLFLREQY